MCVGVGGGGGGGVGGGRGGAGLGWRGRGGILVGFDDISLVPEVRAHVRMMPARKDCSAGFTSTKMAT